METDWQVQVENSRHKKGTVHVRTNRNTLTRLYIHVCPNNPCMSAKDHLQVEEVVFDIMMELEMWYNYGIGEKYNQVQKFQQQKVEVHCKTLNQFDVVLLNKFFGKVELQNFSVVRRREAWRVTNPG